MTEDNFDEFMDSFNKDLEKASDEVQADANTFVLEAHRLVSLKSPVDTGRFRASHQLSINKRDLSMAEDGLSSSEYARAAEKNINGSAVKLSNHKLKDGDKIIIQNNLSYASALENGHSTQAPKGVYATTIEYMKRKLK